MGNERNLKPFRVEISKLDLKPDEDILVITFPPEMSARRIENYLPYIRTALPEGIGVLWLHGNIKLAVMKKNAASCSE